MMAMKVMRETNAMKDVAGADAVAEIIRMVAMRVKGLTRATRPMRVGLVG